MGFLGRILAELARLELLFGSYISAHYDGNNLYLECFFDVVCHYGLFEWFVYVVYVGDGV